MATISYELRPANVGNYGGGVVFVDNYRSFDIGAGLTSGGGTITIDAADMPLVAALDGYAALRRSGSSDIGIAPATARMGALVVSRQEPVGGTAGYVPVLQTDGSWLASSPSSFGASVADDNTFTGANVFQNDSTNVKSKVTFGNTSIVGVRGARKSSYAMGPHAGVGGDTVVDLNQVILTGDWSTDSGGNSPGFLFGANDYVVTGTGAGDALNVNTMMGRLTEVGVKAPNATVTTAVGFQAEAGFVGAASGGTIGTLIVNRVMNPRRKDGATGGTVTGTAYGLYIMKAVAADTGAAAAFSMFVAGGDTKLNGIVNVESDDAARTPFTVKNASGSSQPAMLVQSFAGTTLFSVSSTGGANLPSALTAYNGGGANQASLIAYAPTGADPGTGGGNRGSLLINSTRIYPVSAGVWGFPDGHKIAAGTTNGLTIGTSTSERIGFFGAAGVGRQTLAAAATDLATVITLANSLRTGQINLGLGA